jgi:hypothetical protein
MPLGTSTLSLLTFPQSWDGASLTVRFLCLPRRGPDTALGAGLPDFAHANLVFSARIVSGLDAMPAIAASIEKGPLALESRPLQKADLFQELKNQFDIKPKPAAAPLPNPTFRKAAPASYDQLAGTARRSDYLGGSRDYECALNESSPYDPNEPPPVLDTWLTWGRVIAYALRQPALAEALGLVGQVTVVPDIGFLNGGGWLFVDLHSSSDGGAVAGLAARYAARIPPLDAATPRPLFAAVLFPVDQNITADDVFREAEIYDDGLAKLVHGAQIVDRIVNANVLLRGDAIQLGWDDEQVAIWLNRQAAVAGKELALDAPCGVAGYRIDVREKGEADWHSLVRVASRGDLVLGPLNLGPYDGEGVVETVPSQDAKAAHRQFWLPPYFAAWRGGSLALSDSSLMQIQAAAEGAAAATDPGRLLAREKVFEPVGDADVPLRYGRSYEFRVRLADLTRGGPGWQADQPVAPATGVLAVDFRRRSRPGPLNRLFDGAAPRTVVVEKPRLGYPEALFAGAALADITADLDAIAASIPGPGAPPGITREAGVFDPDVVSVEVAVAVRTLGNDVQEFLPLYVTSRGMPLSSLTLALDFQDVARLDTIDVNQPDDGSLLIPTARDVRLTLTPIARDDRGYFYDESATRGVPVEVFVRTEAGNEAPLLADIPLPATAVQAFFFQPPGPSDAPPCERLGVELGLYQSAMTLSGRAGRRTVFGCSAGFRHTLSPEGASLTFASSSDLLMRWIGVVRFTVERDWTWKGLNASGIVVTRIVRRPGEPAVESVVGAVDLPPALASRQRPDGSPDCRASIRQSTEILFFDAFDPKQEPGKFPTGLTVDYVFQPSFVKAPPPAPETRGFELPITTPPAQVPRLVSAGIALSPYDNADDYSSSSARQRSLWFEFDAPSADPGDGYFVRILGYAPDPLLLQLDRPLPDAPEPPLPIDPESMRRITAGQPHDENGLNAMNGISVSPRDPDKRHYLIPIPDELDGASPELFGFFVYEIRLGHTAGRWSTAQGRFGPPLRVAGVQHPAPPLTCRASRNDEAVRVTAPFAASVYHGRSVRPRSPRSQLWALVYARVRQVDAASWRNILIAQQQLRANDNQPPGLVEAIGEARIPLADIGDALVRIGLPSDAPLTALAAEIFGEPTVEFPLGKNLGRARILRVSPLVSVPDVC